MTAIALAHTSVNVLNASYQPLAATTLARAISLVDRGDAVVEEADPHRVLRHEKGYRLWPLVIRLLRMVRVPVRVGESKWSKSGVLRRDGYLCAYCGDEANTVDHILPVSQGGESVWYNTISACQPCNARKGARTPEEAGMVLIYEPLVPTRVYFRSERPRKKKK